MTQKSNTSTSLVDSTKQVEVFNFNGFSLKTNSLYKVTAKLDVTAPNGYQEHKTTKLPSEGIDNQVCCRFIEDGNGGGFYDTGLYKDSYVFRGKALAEKSQIMTILNKYIVKPFEELQGKPGLLAPTNEDFWNNYLVSLYDDRMFNTENVEDLLALYVVMTNKDLTPVGQEGNPQYLHSQYMIKDSDQAMSVSQERTKEKFASVGYFQQLISSDKEKLNTILRSLNVIGISEVPDEITLQVAFDVWLTRDIQNPSLFIDMYSKAATEEGYQELVLALKVKKAISTRKIIKEGTLYHYNDIVLGADNRAIVTALLTNPDLEEIKDKLMLS